MPGAEGQRFAIARAGAVSPFLILIGATAKSSYVNVNDDGLVARFGYYRVSLPRTQIAAVEHAELPWYWGLGLRTSGRSKLALLGAYHGIVHLTLNEPYRTTLLKIPLKVTDLYVSVEDPDGLIAALQTAP